MTMDEVGKLSPIFEISATSLKPSRRARIASGRDRDYTVNPISLGSSENDGAAPIFSLHEWTRLHISYASR